MTVEEMEEKYKKEIDFADSVLYFDDRDDKINIYKQNRNYLLIVDLKTGERIN